MRFTELYRACKNCFEWMPQKLCILSICRDSFWLTNSAFYQRWNNDLLILFGIGAAQICCLIQTQAATTIMNEFGLKQQHKFFGTVLQIIFWLVDQKREEIPEHFSPFSVGCSIDFSIIRSDKSVSIKSNFYLWIHCNYLVHQ